MYLEHIILREKIRLKIITSQKDISLSFLSLINTLYIIYFIDIIKQYVKCCIKAEKKLCHNTCYNFYQHNYPACIINQAFS